ncbi:MAG: multi-sensor signal transduction histidine kinase [Pedosphaera sp.]|nr:multi-sensor signal transduction histidine kinase [Pedosphaera sp.]
MISSSDIFKAGILIVDDQSANIILLEEMLLGAGYVSVTSTRNPHEVCELHRKNRYSLIVLDLLMPGLDGFQVMEGLKAIETDGYLPVLVQTAQPDHKLRALKAGAKDFVSKPFDLAEVLLRVHNLLEVRLLHLETKRLYDQEQKVSEQLLLVFRSGPIAVSINTIAHGRIIDANQEHCRFFGYTREEMVGGNITDLNLWANPEDRAPVMQRLLKEGVVRGFECKQRLKSGEMRDVLASLELIELAAETDPVLISMFIDITERKQTEDHLKETHKQLLVLSHQAGMAEIATNMLHDVNNVLCSINITSSCLEDSIRNSKAASLSKVVKLLREHEADLGAFLTIDPRGKLLPGFLAGLAGELIREQTAALKDLADLQSNIEHIKHVVSAQQSLAKAADSAETVQIGDVVDEALRMDSGALTRHNVEVIHEFASTKPIAILRHKVLQILLNLVRNAKQSCNDSGRDDKRLTVRVSNGEGRIKIAITDNGIGIPPENLAQIFKHGFTTKKDGHGFGLNSSAMAAKAIGGSLSVHSDGAGHGATFTLELPTTP